MYCKNCGKPNADYGIYCLHCGEKLKKSSFPLQFIKKINFNKKSMPIFLGILLICICIVITYVFNPFGLLGKQYMRNTKWGMTMQDVENSEKGKNVSQKNSRLGFVDNDTKGLEGISALVSYDFNDKNQLISGKIMLLDSSGKISDEELKEKALNSCKNMYGNNFKKEETGYITNYIWTTAKSKINLQFLDKFISIDFQDKANILK